MALAGLVSRQKGRSFLKNLLEERLSSERKVPYLQEGRYLRASSMYSMCPREEVLAALLERVRVDKVDSNLKLIFEHGHALHHQLQNHILPDIGVLLGQWRCNWCMKQHGRWIPGKPPEQTLRLRPAQCSRCKKSDFTYEELAFRDEQLKLAGHMDGVLQLPGRPGLGVLEAKSIGARGGIAVKNAPNIGHVIQAQVYMMLSGFRWAKIVYWQKAQNGLNAIIEHTVDYDEETVQTIKENIRSIWRGIRLGVLPDRICETKTCNRAKECSLVEECFHHETTIR